jgi:hypothetical protein
MNSGDTFLPNGHSFPYGESDNPLDARFLSSRFVPYVSFVCVALNKPHYKDVGGFSEKYFPAYYEDTDLSFRFHNKGLKVLVSPYARVVHKGSQSAAELPEVADIRDKNREQFVSDHAHQLSIMSFDADVVRYPHEGEKLMRRVYPSKKLVMAYRLEDVHEYLSDDKDTFVSIVSFHGTQGDVARLRRLGFEVSIGFGKKLHHWVRERILLFDEIIFCDAFSFERMNEILAFTQPQARVIYEVDSQAEKSGAS